MRVGHLAVHGIRVGADPGQQIVTRVVERLRFRGKRKGNSAPCSSWSFSSPSLPPPASFLPRRLRAAKWSPLSESHLVPWVRVRAEPAGPKQSQGRCSKRNQETEQQPRRTVREGGANRNAEDARTYPHPTPPFGCPFGGSSIASRCLSEGHSRSTTWPYPQRHIRADNRFISWVLSRWPPTRLRRRATRCSMRAEVPHPRRRRGWYHLGHPPSASRARTCSTTTCVTRRHSRRTRSCYPVRACGCLRM